MGKVVLKLESIGHNYGLPPEVLIWVPILNGGKQLPPRQWVAEITGLSDKYGYERRFLRSKIDYSQANSKGTRGVYAYYVLDEGKLYEVKAPISWSRSERYFCTVRDGKIVRLTEEEVRDCLNDRLASTSTTPPESA